MSTFEEIGELPEKYRAYKEALVSLLKRYEIEGIKSLVKAYRNNTSFKSEWRDFWALVAKGEGGKLSLSTIGLIIGASLGGVGIAAMGGAIGMPLALVLGLGGFLGGLKFDSFKIFSEEKRISVKVSKDCLDTLTGKADQSGITLKEYIKLILEAEARQ